MAYRLAVLLAVLCLFVACSTTEPQPELLRLRVLTYNIHHGQGTDGRFDYQRLADIINRVQPDLVALQEVDNKTERSKGVDQGLKLSQLTGMRAHFARAMPYQGGGYGEALLSRWPYNYNGPLPLPAPPGYEPRVAAWSRLRPLGTFQSEIWFIGTHLCHQSATVRMQQFLEINKPWRHANDDPPLPMRLPYEWPPTTPAIPTILAGDFNFTPDSVAYRAVIDAGWVDAAAAFGDPKPTVPADRPTQRIDYVFVRPANRWKVIDVEVLDEPVASDHRPVLVELAVVRPK